MKKNHYFIYVIFLSYICTNILWLLIGLWPFKFNSLNNIIINDYSRSITFKTPSFAYLPSSFLGNFYHRVNDSFSIELCILPEKITTRNFPKIFYIGDKYRDFFIIGQWNGNLIVRFTSKENKVSVFGAGNVLSTGVPTYLLLVNTNDSLRMYVNGCLKKSYPKGIPLTAYLKKDCNISIGNSVSGDQQWEGELSCLNFYNHALTPRECSDHFYKWQSTHLCRFLFYFSANSGKVDSLSLPIVTPNSFFPLQPKYLTPPWIDFKAEFNYASDVILNLIAFIILGFLALAFYSFYFQNRLLLILIAISNSFFISITIETFQIFLPSRTSQLSDLIMNALGGYLGALLFFQWTKFISKRNNCC